jgi:hypothetical protein
MKTDRPPFPEAPAPHDHEALLADPEYAVAWERVKRAVRRRDTLEAFITFVEYERVRETVRSRRQRAA